MPGHAEISLDGVNLTIAHVVSAARFGQKIGEIVPETPEYRRIQESADWVESVVEENACRAAGDEPARAYYGINTGFGIHAAGRPLTDPEQTRQLSRKLIMSHSTGVGEPLDREVVRAAMVIRANTLVNGRSGVRVELINRLIQMLNRGITPMVPRSGSLGASGDLAPLSHLALVISKAPDSLQGEDASPGFGEVTGMAEMQDKSGNSKIIAGKDAMIWEGIDRRIVLRAKEGLALNNGTTFSTALLALATSDAEKLIDTAEIVAALSLEALQGYRDAFLPQLHTARGHPGQCVTASNILKMIRGSQLVDAGDVDRDPVWQPPQDPYSLRCVPQVLGAVREVLASCRIVVTREINAVTDNPLIFVRPEDGLLRGYKALSGGNFHGEYIAFAADHLSIALTELASIAERRVFWILDAKMSRGLPSMLVRGDETHIDSGLMLTQYVAASLVSECKTLAHPDSVDSIPSSANQEDHVSMSMNAALHARTILENATAVVAIELLAAVTAIRHRLNGMRRDGTRHMLDASCLGEGTRIIWEGLYEAAPELFELPLDRDVILYPYVDLLIALVKQGVMPEMLAKAGIRFKRVRQTVEIVD
nr:aromatic amino acid lyase [Anaerolineae bacterium]